MSDAAAEIIRDLGVLANYAKSEGETDLALEIQDVVTRTKRAQEEDANADSCQCA